MCGSCGDIDYELYYVGEECRDGNCDSGTKCGCKGHVFDC